MHWLASVSTDIISSCLFVSESLPSIEYIRSCHVMTLGKYDCFFRTFLYCGNRFHSPIGSLWSASPIIIMEYDSNPVQVATSMNCMKKTSHDTSYSPPSINKVYIKWISLHKEWRNLIIQCHFRERLVADWLSPFSSRPDIGKGKAKTIRCMRSSCRYPFRTAIHSSISRKVGFRCDCGTFTNTKLKNAVGIEIRFGEELSIRIGQSTPRLEWKRIQVYSFASIAVDDII